MLDLNEIQRDNDRIKATAEGSNEYLQKFVKLPEGNGHVTMRFLPQAKPGTFGVEKPPFYQGTRLHRVNGKSIHCPRKLQGTRWLGECPVCAWYSHLWKESENKSAEEAKTLQNQARLLKPVERYYYNVMVRQQVNDKTGEVEKNVGPKIYSCGKTIHAMILRAILGDEVLNEKPLGDITDFKTGRDFKLVKIMKKSGSDNFPTYNESKFLEATPLGTADEVVKWMANLNDLNSLRTLKPIDEVKRELKIHLGLIPNETSDDLSEFQRKPEVFNETSKPSVKVEVSEGLDDPTVGDESLSDDDFMQKLRSV